MKMFCFGFAATVIPLNLVIYFAFTHKPVQLCLVALGVLALLCGVIVTIEQRKQDREAATTATVS